MFVQADACQYDVFQRFIDEPPVYRPEAFLYVETSAIGEVTGRLRVAGSVEVEIAVSGSQILDTDTVFDVRWIQSDFVQVGIKHIAADVYVRTATVIVPDVKESFSGKSTITLLLERGSAIDISLDSSSEALQILLESSKINLTISGASEIVQRILRTSVVAS